MTAAKKNLLKISQLARRAGVSIPTVKHYLREGLLHRPVKTSRNMAYYKEDDIHRIKLVKKMQKERFLPLEVIKRLLDAGESFDEELALGKAILGTDRTVSYAMPVKRSSIEEVTGYPLDRIDILEEKGLIHPLTEENGKVYLPEDLTLIEIMKSRDSLGVPFDASLSTLNIYGDALARAVQEDINFFVRNIMPDTPTRQAIRFITEADETLDSFIISYRQKMLRQFSEKAIKILNRLPKDLTVLNFLPAAGTLLPERPPDHPFYNLVYRLLKEDRPAAEYKASPEDLAQDPPRLRAMGILSILISGNTANALKLVQALIPRPTHIALENTVAALTYLFSMGMSSGFSTPMFEIKKVFHFLSHIEHLKPDFTLENIFSRYTCGAVYIFLPGVFATRRTGIDILEKLKIELDRISWEQFNLPAWLVHTLDVEILPDLIVRINRFLVQGYLKIGEKSLAAASLEEVVNQADPDSEHGSWARLERIRLSE